MILGEEERAEKNRVEQKVFRNEKQKDVLQKAEKTKACIDT